MIKNDGWAQYSLWEHSRSVAELYERRARGEAEELTCHAQAAELLAPNVSDGDTVLDVGCGSGYFFHSLRNRDIPAEYWGIDATPSFIATGRRALARHGLAPDRLTTLRIEDLAGSVDHVVCINVLSNIDNYHRPLERLLDCARKTVILRESLAPTTSYHYVADHFLDPGIILNVYVNTYAIDDVLEFCRARNFDAEIVTDQRSGGSPEMVIGHPHYWTFLVARRRDAGN